MLNLENHYKIVFDPEGSSYPKSSSLEVELRLREAVSICRYFQCKARLFDEKNNTFQGMVNASGIYSCSEE